ncbi:hypothetical protein UFOVP35_62 [uncultured Caudovirales phage]|uniref:Uncharacterized protein n=1 Tax=uncultured Caudovirales phage TaxID=2100421 RepID=A0A6J5KR85_9CAUD|nr:hypothetical protein UFOVP35_62 [uncultured Caudovirales phage]CAB4124875.1 hypothetical protein UFOVP52_61 [uncultured Caudovirales phage]CAB5219802.1 hypothetical protein UFOVP234_9 [uncultured Caudovirales phage]
MNTMTTATNSVDRLGALLAQMEILSAQAEEIKDELKEAATATLDANKCFEGESFKAIVVQADRTNVAYAKLVKDMKIADDIIKSYSKVSAVFSVKVTAK